MIINFIILMYLIIIIICVFIIDLIVIADNVYLYGRFVFSSSFPSPVADLWPVAAEHPVTMAARLKRVSLKLIQTCCQVDLVTPLLCIWDRANGALQIVPLILIFLLDISHTLPSGTRKIFSNELHRLSCIITEYCIQWNIPSYSD